MLWRKVLRDLKDNKGSYIACATVMVIGLLFFTSFSMVLENMDLAQKNFYYYYNFADGFAEVAAMPHGEIEKLRSIEGIKEIQGRLIKDVRVVFPGREDNVYLRLVSVDPGAVNPLNGVRLEMGIPLEEREMNIWIDNKFYQANGLELNSEIEIIAEGKKRSLRIAGAGVSPEFIYAMRSSGDLFPRPEEFGIAYLPYKTMETFFQEKGSVNSLIFKLMPGADYQGVEDRLKAELKAYGLKSIYPRKDQASHVILSEELEQLGNMGRSIPLIFLSVASIILYIMLRRMIENQRVQIGVLKAMGYTDREVMFHYLSYALVVGAAGGIAGGLLGAALSRPYTDMYRLYFNIPGLESRFSLAAVFLSLALSLTFSAIAGYRGCRAVLALEPAEAMRPRSPLPGKSVLLERVSFFWKALNVQGKMAVRNLARNKSRSFFIVIGITFTFALLSMSWSMWELSEEMLFDQFEKIETYDVKINLSQPLKRSLVERELSGFPGVKSVESKAEIPVTLRNKWNKKDVVLLGLPAGSKMHRVLDADSQPVQLPHRGVVISERLAQLLEAEVGTELTLESLMLKDPDSSKKVEVAGVIPQYLGLNAYMEIEALQSLLGQGEIVTTAMLKIDERDLPLLHQEYRNSAVISGIEDRAKMLRQLRELMGSYSATIYIMLLIGMVVGFAIIYNTSVISVSERSRELASMMVLGMTPSEVLSVITFEQWFLSAFGMLGGIPLTKLMLVGLARSISNDVYSMPTALGMMSVAVAVLFTVLSIWIGQRAAAGKIRSLHLADVLKAAE
ncbi:MAG: FtsX-like permease family protein [Peptococcaceae bacterium]|jgi:putative ABC transport system permease protein|nr:ABC transporter permease [Peptococcaceae bacterium]MDH7523988.1 FtsX-like permease family protein [Peptococcaceae bacterium]